MKIGDIFVYNFGAGSHRYVVIGKKGLTSALLS